LHQQHTAQSASQCRSNPANIIEREVNSGHSSVSGSDTSVSANSSAIQNFVITADDSGASPDVVNVAAGSIVEITFNVSATNVYHGGLEFKSPNLNTGRDPGRDCQNYFVYSREVF